MFSAPAFGIFLKVVTHASNPSLLGSTQPSPFLINKPFVRLGLATDFVDHNSKNKQICGPQASMPPVRPDFNHYLSRSFHGQVDIHETATGRDAWSTVPGLSRPGIQKCANGVLGSPALTHMCLIRVEK